MRRIGIDARELCGRATGVGRYLSGLLRQWNTSAASHHFVLYAHEPLTLSLDPSRFTTKVVAGSGGSWWEQIDLPRAAADDRLDVFFSPAYTAPLRLGVPIVVAIHDLSFVAHPEWFRFREGIRRRWLTSRAAAGASAIVTISEFSKRELTERLDVAAAKIHVIPPGLETQGLGAGGSELASLEAQAPSARVLFVGSIFNRRHVPDLVRAFAPIARADRAAGLDLVGDDRSYPPEDPQRTIDAEGLQAQVVWHRYVTEDQLQRLFGRARAFAFLSEYEGLGLTPLEALAAGVPPVLLDTPVARESCGDAALYVALGDRRGTTRALETALSDEDVRQRILTAAPTVLARYRWPHAARATLAVLEHA